MFKKTILLIALVAITSAQFPFDMDAMQAEFNTEIAKKIAEGILTKFAEVEAPIILTCVKDGTILYTDFKNAVQDFEKKSLSGVKNGLHELAQGLEHLKTAITDCQGAEQEVEKMYKAIKAMDSPWSFAYTVGKNLLVNGKDIYKNIQDANSHFQSQSWFDFGEDIGTIITELASSTTMEQIMLQEMVTVPETTMNFQVKYGSMKEVAQIFEGILEGFVAKEMPSVISCVKDSETTFTDFKKAVQDFEKKSLSGVKNGLHELAQGLESLKSALTDCAGAKKEVENLINAMLSMRSPWKLVYHIGRDLVVNGRDIYNNVKDAKSNFKSQSWFAFGEDIGKIIADLAGVSKPHETNIPGVPKCDGFVCEQLALH